MCVCVCLCVCVCVCVCLCLCVWREVDVKCAGMECVVYEEGKQYGVHAEYIAFNFR